MLVVQWKYNRIITYVLRLNISGEAELKHHVESEKMILKCKHSLREYHSHMGGANEIDFHVMISGGFARKNHFKSGVR